MRLSEGRELMLRHRSMRKVAPATLEFRVQTSNYLVESFGDIELKAFDGPAGGELIDNWVVEMEDEEGLHPHTIVKRLGTLRKILFIGVRAGEIQQLPIWTPVSREYTPRDTYIREADYPKLRAQLLPHRQLWLDLAVYTGMRSSNLAEMTWDHLKWEGGVTYWLRRATKARGKKKPEWFEAPPPLAAALAAHPGPHEGLVVGPWDRAARDLTAAAARAGLKLKLSPNDLRRTYATWSASRGVSMDLVRHILGHGPKSLMLELVYRQFTDQMKEKAAAAWRDGGNDGAR